MRKKKREDKFLVRKSENRILVAFLLNLIFTFVEVFGSVLTGSVTIMSDAVHDFGDCIALAVAWRMEKLSKRPPNEQYQFGYRRFSVVAGLVNNLILLAGGVVLITASVQRFFNPRVIDGRGMLVFSVFGIAVNGAAMLLTSRGKNINEKTISMHMLEDVLTWLTVFCVGVVMCFYELPVLDSLLSIAMTLVIFAGVFRNLKKIVAIITVRSPLSVEEYRALAAQIDGMNEVGGLEKLRLFTLDGEDKNAEVCLVVYEELGTEDMMQLFLGVQKCCEEAGVEHAVIQVRYEGSVTDENEG